MSEKEEVIVAFLEVERYLKAFRPNFEWGTGDVARDEKGNFTRDYIYKDTGIDGVVEIKTAKVTIPKSAKKRADLIEGMKALFVLPE